MQIHHTKIKQAMEIGCYISMADNRVRIFWPQRAVELFAATPDEALTEMQAVQNILHSFADYKVVPNGDNRVIVTNAVNGYQMNISPEPPSVLLAALEAGEDEWTPANGEKAPEPNTSVDDRIAGIPQSGRAAYNEGVPASDCPYPEEDDDFGRWNSEWDEAADESEAEEERQKPPAVGSIVTNRYRASYSELGHPTHCGDDLAVLLNSICQNKAGTNLEIFEAICAANGVDLSKYNRTKKGWQGRLRMTGRNLLAKRVIAQGGRLNMPEYFGKPHHQLGEAWVTSAGVKYKPKG